MFFFLCRDGAQAVVHHRQRTGEGAALRAAHPLLCPGGERRAVGGKVAAPEQLTTRGGDQHGVFRRGCFQHFLESCAHLRLQWFGAEGAIQDNDCRLRRSRNHGRGMRIGERIRQKQKCQAATEEDQIFSQTVSALPACGSLLQEEERRERHRYGHFSFQQMQNDRNQNQERSCEVGGEGCVHHLRLPHPARSRR